MSEKEISVAPARTIKALTPSDSVNFADRPRGIIIGDTGNVVIVNEDDTTTTILSGEIATGIVHPVSPKRINATDTTATKFYGVY